MNPDFEELSLEDKEFVKNGGIIIRPKGTLEIECITRPVPYWHRHVATDIFENMFLRDMFFKKMLQFADYKPFKN